jgi:hypothetical protein
MDQTSTNNEFWHDLWNEEKWRAAARQMVRFLLMEGLPPCEAIAEAIRISRAREGSVVLDEFRNMATEL